MINFSNENQTGLKTTKKSENSQSKSRVSLFSVLSGGVSRVTQWIRSHDIYGQPVNINYEGEETYKTCPGGIISLILFAVVLMYTSLKSN